MIFSDKHIDLRVQRLNLLIEGKVLITQLCFALLVRLQTLDLLPEKLLLRVCFLLNLGKL